MKYGLFDTRDNLWLGDDTGPMLYDEFNLAKISAEIQAVRLGWDTLRIEAREFPTDQPMNLRDEVRAKKSSVEALKLIEEGYIS